jgi:hypothetical protein
MLAVCTNSGSKHIHGYVDSLCVVPSGFGFKRHHEILDSLAILHICGGVDFMVVQSRRDATGFDPNPFYDRIRIGYGAGAPSKVLLDRINVGYAGGRRCQYN